MHVAPHFSSGCRFNSCCRRRKSPNNMTQVVPNNGNIAGAFGTVRNDAHQRTHQRIPVAGHKYTLNNVRPHILHSITSFEHQLSPAAVNKTHNKPTRTERLRAVATTTFVVISTYVQSEDVQQSLSVLHVRLPSLRQTRDDPSPLQYYQCSGVCSTRSVVPESLGLKSACA